MDERRPYESWKEFARATERGMDDLKEANDKLETANEKLRDQVRLLEVDYSAFKSKVTTTFIIVGAIVGGVIIAIIGIFEYSIHN